MVLDSKRSRDGGAIADTTQHTLVYHRPPTAPLPKLGLKVSLDSPHLAMSSVFHVLTAAEMVGPSITSTDVKKTLSPGVVWRGAAETSSGQR